VVDEIETLERRVRAFSEFAAEPPVLPCEVDINSLVEERVALSQDRASGSGLRLPAGGDVPHVVADQDLLKGILTNLLENAAEAAGAGGHILGVTAAEDGRVAIEVHDSGPGLSEQARPRCFSRPFRSRSGAWGWGFRSRARGALLSGGDIVW
jgi:two-component system, NtrC family, nitrogen regulation sensor histidine kinase NtrY